MYGFWNSSYPENIELFLEQETVANNTPEVIPAEMLGMPSDLGITNLILRL